MLVEQRKYHVMAQIGKNLITHGGLNSNSNVLSDLVGVNMENFEWFNIPIKGKSLYRAYHQACSVFTVYSLQHSKFSICYVPEFKFFGQFSIKEVGVYVFGGMEKNGHFAFPAPHSKGWKEVPAFLARS